MFCAHCGSKIEEGQKFCEVCGTKVEIPTGNAAGAVSLTDSTARQPAQQAAAVKQTAATEASRVSPTAQAAPQAPAAQAQAPRRATPAASLHKREGLRAPQIVGAVIGGLLIAAAGIFAFTRMGSLAAVPKAGAQQTSAQDAASSADDEGAGQSQQATSSPASSSSPSQARLSISQVDVSSYPTITLYVDARDSDNSPLTGLDAGSFSVEEITPSSASVSANVTKVAAVSKGSSTYRVTYESTTPAGEGFYLTARISCSEASGLAGTAESTYQVPVSQPEQEESSQRVIEVTMPASPSTHSSSSGGYILPESDSRYYSESELRGLSDWELEVARNEIFARHGRGFRDAELQNYFNSQSWYRQLYTPEEYDAMGSQLNQYETANVALIGKVEESR